MASRGISCFITSPPGVDRPRPMRVDSRREKKKKEKERKDTRSCGSSFAGRERRSLFFSSLFPRRTLIPRSRGRRVFVPTIVRPDNGPTTHAEVSILSPSIPFFFSLYSRPATTSSLTPSLSIIDRKKFHVARETFSLSRVPLFDKARPRTGRLSFELPETAPSNGTKHIFPCSRSRFGLLSRRLGCFATSRCRDAGKRGFPLGIRSQFTEELILLSTKRGREVRKEPTVARVTTEAASKRKWDALIASFGLFLHCFGPR